MEQDDRALEILERARAYDMLFSSELGQKILEDLKRYSYFNHSTHVMGDPYETAFREGRRFSIMRIARLLEIAKNPDSVTEKYKQGGASWVSVD